MLAVELEHLVHGVARREDDAVARDRVRLTVPAVAYAVKLAWETARARVRARARARERERARPRERVVNFDRQSSRHLYYTH